LVTKQFKRVPAIEEDSELPPAAPFPRGDALGVIEDPSGTEFGMFARVRPRVKAKEPSPAGAPLKMVVAGSVGATAPAGWT
jgi:hypothetical protein